MSFNLALKSPEERAAIENHKKACWAAHKLNLLAAGLEQADKLRAWYQEQSNDFKTEYGEWFLDTLADASFSKQHRR